MIIEHGKARFVQMEEELELFETMGVIPVKRLTGALNCIKVALNDLRDYLLANPFIDKEEEICFFKYIKPKFTACEIFLYEKFNIENSKPLGEKTIQIAHLEQELNFIKRYLDKFRFLYQYYLLDGHELDASYFLRGVQPSSVFVPDTPDRDPLFSTACDYFFARFIACEKLQDFLINELYEETQVDFNPRRSDDKNILKWTGEKSNLVELAYGIYGTMQINEGNATIAEIISWLEGSLNVSLSRYYRRFSEIKMRKAISKTRYLDELREALSQHIEAGEAYKPKPIKTSFQRN